MKTAPIAAIIKFVLLKHMIPPTSASTLARIGTMLRDNMRINSEKLCADGLGIMIKSLAMKRQPDTIIRIPATVGKTFFVDLP